jgi:hypothetical protein
MYIMQSIEVSRRKEKQENERKNERTKESCSLYISQIVRGNKANEEEEK